MLFKSKPLWIGLVGLTLLVNAAILFFLIPKISVRLHSSYNQNEYADGYDQLAANLAKGDGYRMYPDTAETIVREPGYPILLAGIFILFGNNFTVVKLANLLLAFAAALLMMRIARRFSSGPVLILLSPLLFLFHPATLTAESRGGSEVLFTFCLMVFLLTVYRAIENKRWRYYAGSGAALGLTVLVKSTPILFPLFLLAYLLVVERQGSRIAVCRNIVLMVVAMFVVLSPWIIRNYRLTGKFIPTATVMGISAHAGLYDNTHVSGDNSWAMADRDGARVRRKIAQELGYPFKDVQNSYYQDFYSTNDEVKFSNYLFKAVVREYEKSPMLYVRCVSSNLFNLWFRGKTTTATMMNVVVQAPYLILSILGLVLSIIDKQVREAVPMALLIIYLTAVYVAILAQARYSVPLIPYLSILACITLVAARERLVAKIERRTLGSPRGPAVSTP